MEKFFKAIVIVIPHPKYKSKKKGIKSLNPYFNNREVNNDYDSLGELSSKCLFFISTYSTAISYAVFHNKPIMNIFSSQYQHTREDIEGILLQSGVYLRACNVRSITNNSHKEGVSRHLLAYQVLYGLIEQSWVGVIWCMKERENQINLRLIYCCKRSLYVIWYL